MTSFIDTHWDDKKVYNIEFCDSMQHNQLFSRMVVVDYNMSEDDVERMFLLKSEGRVIIKHVDFLDYCWSPK